MTTGPAHNVVRAKTGTLNIRSALSGYAGPYAFSVIVNGRAVNQTAAHALQDRIAQYLAREA
jgi:D-alanyl-D-alanine carboxypeptidase